MKTNHARKLRLINELRNARAPLPLGRLAAIYQEGTGLACDLAALKRHRLAGETEQGIVWLGS